MMLKIKNRRIREHTEKKPGMWSQDLLHSIWLDRYHVDPTISHIHFQKNCTAEIRQFIEASLSPYPVAEVGGFLLGTRFQENGRFQTIVEQFVPCHQVAYNSPILLDFGTAAMLEWDRALEKHPHLESVGWVHTHPGHSPYLSATDLNLHEGFFTRPFQFALVIDPLTEAWDTGLFCRTKENKMIQKMRDQHFFSWLDLQNVSV